jgi:hypothetical protein
MHEVQSNLSCYLNEFNSRQVFYHTVTGYTATNFLYIWKTYIISNIRRSLVKLMMWELNLESTNVTYGTTTNISANASNSLDSSEGMFQTITTSSIIPCNVLRKTTKSLTCQLK